MFFVLLGRILNTYIYSQQQRNLHFTRVKRCFVFSQCNGDGWHVMVFWTCFVFVVISLCWVEAKDCFVLIGKIHSCGILKDRFICCSVVKYQIESWGAVFSVDENRDCFDWENPLVHPCLTAPLRYKFSVGCTPLSRIFSGVHPNGLAIKIFSGVHPTEQNFQWGLPQSAAHQNVEWGARLSRITINP